MAETTTTKERPLYGSDPDATNVDWFKARKDGTIQGSDYKDIFTQMGGQKTELKTSAEYWNDTGLRTQYEEQYGDKAKEVFDKEYTVTAADFQQFNQFDHGIKQFATNQRRQSANVVGGESWGYDPENLKTMSPSFEERYMRSDGAMDQGLGMSEADRDPRELAMESRKFQSYDGSIRDMPTWDEVHAQSNGTDYAEDYLSWGDSWGNNAMAFNNNYTDDKGNHITGFGYPPEMLQGDYRGPRYIKALYEGGYRDSLDYEIVSKFDYAGFTSMDRNAGWTSFVPRVLANGITNMYKGVGTLAAAGSAMLGWNDSKEWVEDHWLMGANSAKVSEYLSTQENGLASWDGAMGFVGDTLMQLFVGAGIGKAGAASSTVLGAGVKMSGKVGKYSSLMAMTAYGAADSYDSALRAGYTDKQAGVFYMTNMAALFAVNKRFNVLEDAFATNKMMKESSKLWTKNMAYAAPALKKAVAAGDDKAAQTIMKTYTQKMYNGLSKVATKIKKLEGYPKAMLTEAAEEIAETVSQKTLEQAFNATTAMGITDGNFKSMYDEGYWEEYGQELLLSAAGGALGGAFAKTFYHKRDDGKKREFLDMVMDDDGSMLDQLDELHKSGALGSFVDSTEWDADEKRYKTMVEAGETAMSMADANKQVLQQEYAYVKGIVDTLGSKDAVKNMTEKHPGLASAINNMQVVNDVKALTKQYTDLHGEHENMATEAIPRTPEDMEEGSEEEAKFIKKESDNSGLTPEVTKQVADIKAKIDDISSGKSAEKYFMKAAARGTLFDTESDLGRAYAEYGDDFLHELMKVSGESSVDVEEKSKKNLERIGESGKVLASLEKDLSNIDEVADKLMSGDRMYISDQVKEKIEKLYEEQKVPNDKLSELQKKIQEQVVADGKYELSTIVSSEEFKALRKTNPEKADKYAAFLSSFLKTKFDEKLNAVKTMDDIRNLDFESNISLEDILYTIQEQEFDFSLESMTGGEQDIHGHFDAKTEEELVVIGEKLGKIFAQNEDAYKFDIGSESFSNLTTSEFSEHVADLMKNFNKLSELYDLSKNAPTEEEVAFDRTKADFLLNGFAQDEHAGLMDSGNLGNQMAAILYQIEKQKLSDDDDFGTYNNSDEPENILKQAEARAKQIDMLLFALRVDNKDGGVSYNPLVEQSGAADIAALRVRQERINSKPKAKSRDIILGAVTAAETSGTHSEFFNKMGLNPVMWRDLNSRKDELSAEEVEMHKEYSDTLGNVIEAKVALEGIVTDAKKAISIAKHNQDSKNIVNNQREAISANIKHEADILDKVINHADMEDVEELEFFHTHNFNDSSDAGVVKSFNVLLDAKRLIYSALKDKDDKIEEILDALFANLNGIANGRRVANDVSRAATMLTFDEASFYARYKSILADFDLGGSPTVEQEQVGLSIMSHMMGNGSNVVNDVLGANVTNTVVINGRQGTGKSTFALGVGVASGQAEQIEKFGEDKSRVLLSANTPKQVSTLVKTAEKFGINIKRFGTANGLTSVRESDSSMQRPLDLIQKLEENKDIDDVSTIVFDEASFIQYEGSEPSDLKRIMDAISKINKGRDGINTPKMSLVLMGDSGQNGHRDADGAVSNIFVEDRVYGPRELTLSHRAKVLAITDATAQIEKDRRNLKIKTEWGAADEVSKGLLAGVRVRPTSDNVFDDNDLVSNIRQQIEERIGLPNTDPFEVGVILPAGEVMPTGSLMEVLRVQYPDNFRVTDHVDVQGDEFDYVIARMTANEIGESAEQYGAKQHLMVAAANKLSTTIGRGRYFITLINDTQRPLSSDGPTKITIVESAMNEIVAAQVLELKMEMLGLEAKPVDKEVLEKTDKELERKARVDQDEVDEVAKRVEEDKDRNIILKEEEGDAVNIENVRVAGLYELLLFNHKDKVHEFQTAEEQSEYINRMAPVDNPEQAKGINELADAKLALLDSQDYATLVAATMKYEDSDNAEFNDDVISSVQQTIDTHFEGVPVGTDITEAGEEVFNLKRIYDSVSKKINTDSVVQDINIATPEQQESLDKAVLNKAAETVAHLQDSVELTSKDVTDLKEQATIIANKIESKEATKEDLIDLMEQIALLESGEIMDAAEDKDDVTPDHNPVFAESMASKNKVAPENETWEQRRTRTNKEREMAVQILETAGYLMAYPNNDGNFEGKKGYELEKANVARLFPGEPTPTTKEAYDLEQLRALDLKNGYSVGDYDYSLVATKRGSFVEMLVTAKNRKTKERERVVVGGVYYIQLLRDNGRAGGDMLAQLENAISQTAVNRIDLAIDDPRILLNLKSLSPGSLTDNKAKKVVLSDWRKEVDLGTAKVSKKVFIDTRKNLEDGTLNPHRGDAFLLYSHDDKMQFTERDVREILATGLPLHGDAALSGFKRGIGILHLDNKPSSLTQLVDLFNDEVFSRATELYKVVNPNKGQDRMVTAIAQMREVLAGVEGLPMPGRMANFLEGNKKLEYSKESDGEDPSPYDVLYDEIAAFKELESKDPKDPSKPGAYQAFVEIIKTITDERSLGQFGRTADNNFSVKTNETTGKERPVAVNDRANPITLLNSKDLTDSVTELPEGAEIEDTIQFNMDSFIEVIQSISKFNGINPKSITALMDGMLGKSQHFKSGFFMRPLIASRTGSQRDFATLEPIPGLEDNFLTNVIGIKPPVIRFDIASMSGLIENGKAPADDTPFNPFGNEKSTVVLAEEITKEIKDTSVFTAPFVEAKTEAQARKAYAEFKTAFARLTTLARDVRGSEGTKVKNALSNIKKMTDSAYKISKKRIKESTPDRVENTKESLQLSIADLVNNEASVIAEMEVIKKQAAKDKNFMKAPNGQPTKLSEEQWLYSRTSTFKNWVGDWDTADARDISTLLDAETKEPVVFFYGSLKGEEDPFTTQEEVIFTNNKVVADSRVNEGGILYSMFVRTEDSQSVKYGEMAEPFEETQDSWHTVHPDGSLTISVPTSDQLRVMEGDDYLRAETNPDESPEMTELKKSLADLSNMFVQRSPFVFSQVDLDDFHLQLQTLTKSDAAAIVEILEADSDDKLASDKVISNLKAAIDELEKRVAAPAEEIEKAIKENMAREYKESDLPTSIPAVLATDSLSGLLVKFHVAKAGGSDVTPYEQEIGRRYLSESKSDVTQVKESLIATPITSNEDYKARAEQLRALKLPTNEAAEVARELVQLRKESKEYAKIASLAAEAGLTIEDVNELKDSDFKTLLTDSLSEEGETLDGSLTPDAQKIIDSTWSDVENLLSLPLDNSASIAKVAESLEQTLAATDARMSLMKQFITDSFKKQVIDTKYDEMKTQVLERVAEAQAENAAQAANVDTTIASKENLFPTFVDSTLKVALDPAVEEAVRGLEASEISTWVELVNGMLLDPSTESTKGKLYSALRKKVSRDAYKTALDYMTKKQKDSICRG
jgi:hypothetical protein